MGDEPKRFYSTLPGPVRGRERETSNGVRKEEGGQGGGGVRHSLYQSPHLLLLQGYNRQVRTTPGCCFAGLNEGWIYDASCAVCRTAWCTCWTESSTPLVRRLHPLDPTSAFSPLTSYRSTAAYAGFLRPAVRLKTRQKSWRRISGSVLPLSRCFMPQFWWTFPAVSAPPRCDMVTSSLLERITSSCTRIQRALSHCLLRLWHAFAPWGSFLIQ